MNLMELTGQESGLLVWSTGETIICNWNSSSDGCLPHLCCECFLVNYPCEWTYAGGNKWYETIKAFIDWFGKKLDVIFANGEDAEEILQTPATVYTIGVGGDTVYVIAPAGWN